MSQIVSQLTQYAELYMAYSLTSHQALPSHVACPCVITCRHATAGKRMSMGPPSPADIRQSKARRMSDEGPSGAAHGLPHGGSPHESTDAMHVDANDRLCITVDAAGKRKSSFIRLGIEMASTGNAVRCQVACCSLLAGLHELAGIICACPSRTMHCTGALSTNMC